MSAPDSRACEHCGRPLGAALDRCPHCESPIVQGTPSEVPPGLAIAVTLGLVGGVALLGFLFFRLAARPEPHPSPAPPVVIAKASPSPSPKPARPKPFDPDAPRPEPTPESLPMGPVDGGPPPVLGMPPAPPPPFGPSAAPLPPYSGPRYPGL